MKIGDPLDRSTAHGPQNHRAHLEKLVGKIQISLYDEQPRDNIGILNFQEYCQIGVKEGARLVYGGKQADRPGLYMEPTIFADVEDHMFVAKVRPVFL